MAKTLGHSQRVLVISPGFLDRYGRPEDPADLPKFNTVASTDDIFDNGARWTVTDRGTRTQQIELRPRLVTSDLRTRLQAAIRGSASRYSQNKQCLNPLKEGLIERVLPEWSAASNILHLVYPTPRGMLPSVRSLIDYLLDPCSCLAPGADDLKPNCRYRRLLSSERIAPASNYALDISGLVICGSLV